MTWKVTVQLEQRVTTRTVVITDESTGLVETAEMPTGT